MEGDKGKEQQNKVNVKSVSLGCFFLSQYVKGTLFWYQSTDWIEGMVREKAVKEGQGQVL